MNITVPTSWRDITIKQFMDLHNAGERKDDLIDYLIDVVCICCGLSYIDACKLSITDLRGLHDKMNFLNTPIDEKAKVTERYELEGKMFCASIDISKITSGQYIDLKTFICDGTMNNLHNIMASLYIPYKKKYNDMPHGEVAEMFLNKMPITVAFPMSVFFLALLNYSMRDIEDFMQIKIETDMKTAIAMLTEKV